MRWQDAAAPKVLCHSSNFRPLKRIEDVLGILVGVRKVMPAVLKLVGDGPERPRIEQQVRALTHELKSPLTAIGGGGRGSAASLSLAGAGAAVAAPPD